MVESRIDRYGNSSILVRQSEAARITPRWFGHSHWRERNLVVGEEAGRGSVLFVSQGDGIWALRHYRRGGVVSRLTADRYVWTGLEHTRAFREWRLLLELHEAGMPVPDPVAAHVIRHGLSYRGDIITERIADARSLASIFVTDKMHDRNWEDIGTTLRRFHDRGVDHADLNAHNVLLDRGGRVFLVDFDRGVIRAGGRWKQRNLNRLRRSLAKISRQSGAVLDETDWGRLLRGYRSRR